MDPMKKRRKTAKPRDKKSRHDGGHRFRNIGIVYPRHKSVAIEMPGYEEELNSDLGYDTQIPFPTPATSMDIDEGPPLSENVLRQQRKLKRRKAKSNLEMAALRKAAKNRIDICGLLQMELSEQDLFMQTEPELADATIDAAVISAQDTTSENLSCNPFNNMKDWRSFNFEVMDEACKPVGVWDKVMKKIVTFKTGRSKNIRHAAVLPSDHGELTVAGVMKLNKKMEVIGCFLDLLALSYNNDERLNITYISDYLTFGRSYSGQAVRDWVLDFLQQEGMCRGVSFKRRTPYSLIHDEQVKNDLTNWLLVATRATPPCLTRIL